MLVAGLDRLQEAWRTSAGVSESARNTENSIALTITSENWR